MTELAIQLYEWEKCTPETDPRLCGLKLSPKGSHLAKELRQSHKIEILELVGGLEFRATSWVGRIELESLTITVRPKIGQTPLLHLLRYAYGLRNLSVINDARYKTEYGTFQDIIAQQLAFEAEELIARGLHREYVCRRERLSVPKGRIDFQRYIPAGSAALPCIHHPRSDDTILNRVLLAGLLLAARTTKDIQLRGHLHRLVKSLNLDSIPIKLSQDVMDCAWAATDRRTRDYQPSLTLIALLLLGWGISMESGVGDRNLPGFLFDMNRFFQAVVSRFLKEHLPSHTVQDEHGLKGMFQYALSGNPRRRRAPTLRPDFMVFSGDKILSVLDAKYRDLWALNLPHEMLYQLAMYALGHNGPNRQSAILYPTLEKSATEQRILLKNPIDGTNQAIIDLRPIKLLELTQLVEPGAGNKLKSRCIAMAMQLAFGGKTKPTIH